jgi:hypothetical protein
MTDNLLPCPFCGGDARNDAHADDCYFILHKAMVNAPNADLSMVPDVLKAWNRRTALLVNEQNLREELAALRASLSNTERSGAERPTGAPSSPATDTK